MPKRAHARSGDRDVSQRLIRAREAVLLDPKYIAELTRRQPSQMTSVEPTEEGGWIVEAEVVEESRIPSSADMLALYEIRLDADGELLAYRRTRRYMRYAALPPTSDMDLTA